MKQIKKIGLGLGGLAFLALTATTSLKDNVHFGSTEIRNPKKNQYVWSLFFPKLTIRGENAEGDFYSIGLLGSEINFPEGVNHTGNSNSTSLFASLNTYEENSTHTGNSNSTSLLVSLNTYEENSTHTGNSNSTSLFASLNAYKENSTHTGNSNVKALLIGSNKYYPGATITGNSSAFGVLSETPSGLHFLCNKELGLENYIVEKPEQGETQ
jgi:hypothetical protein